MTGEYERRLVEDEIDRIETEQLRSAEKLLERLNGLASDNSGSSDSSVHNGAPAQEHQIRGVIAGWRAARNYDTVCLTGPTGCGKSYIITALTNLALLCGMKVAIYSDRKLIILQTHKNLSGHNVSHGVRSASLKRLENLHQDVQICSMQTEMARSIRTERTALHRAGVVIVDEAHKQASAGYLDVLQRHLAMGAKIFGITASPIEIAHLYKKLEVFACNSEMFRIGALVPARVRTITEMDTSRIKPVKTGEYLEGDIMKECWSPAIVGHIYKDWKTLNPDARPALCFAPGVAGSVWIAKEFHKHGVRLAHVDAQDIWVDGAPIKDDQEGTVRQQIVDDIKTGRVVGITNCQVFQEGVDLPLLYHLILATPIGSRRNAVQVFGRVMRYHESTPDHCLITDHAGNCLDSRTEVLTPSGWKGMYDKFTQVAAYCPRTGLVKYQNVTDRIVRRVLPGERMSVLESPQFDVRVTEGHRVLFKKRQLLDGKMIWEEGCRIAEAGELTAGNLRFQLPVSGFQNEEKAVNLSKHELEMIGWFLSDGHFEDQTKRPRNLSFTQSAHQPWSRI